MEYVKTVLKRPVPVESVISVHYYEYPIDFTFSGEIHDFWEMVYADKGDAIITAGSRELRLPCGQMYLHKPMEYHNIRCNESGTVNSVIISFSSACPELYELAGKPIPCESRQRELMAEIILEVKNAFSSPLGEVIVPRLIRREDALFGSEQLIQLYLEQLLVLLVRGNRLLPTPEPALPYTSRQRKGDTLLHDVCGYLEEHIADSLHMADLCRRFSVSESTLQKLFQSRIGYGVSKYHQQLRVDSAKTMIREKRYNFTEISQQLGYSSVHYFSRHFKQATGMTPSEYAASVKAMIKS